MVRPKDKRADGIYLLGKYKAARVRVSRLLGLSLSTLDYASKPRDDERLKAKLSELATQHRRFGHPRLLVLLRREGIGINHKRSRRVYRELGLQIGRRKRKKLGAATRQTLTKATKPNEAWAIDFMFDYLESARRLKVLTVVDEFSKTSPGLLVDHSIRGIDVTSYLDHLAGGVYPKVIRVDQGTEFTSRAMLDWAYRHGIELQFTRVRKPNQIIESFNSRMRDECLNEHVFFSLADAREKIDDWHWRYNNFNPHSSLGMKTPAEFAKEIEVVLAS